MYAELLKTPHPEKGCDQQPLLEAVDPEFIRTKLGQIAVSQPEMIGTANVYAADMISREVSRALWFPMCEEIPPRDDFVKYGIVDPVDTSELYGNQLANCFGYTIVLSECLERAGIHHYVGYGANHAFTILPVGNAEAPEYWYIDALWPELNQDMTPAIVLPRPNFDAATDISKYGRTSFKVDVSQFAANVGRDYLQLLIEKRWPVVRSSDIERLKRDTKDDNFYERIYSEYMIVSAFPSDQGRKMLDNYSSFRKLCTLGQYDSAFVHLQSIGSNIPEIDVRSGQHAMLRDLALALALGNNIELAIEAVETYFSGFGMSDHPNVDVLHGDIFRKIAEYTAMPDFAIKAHKKYVSAASKRVKPIDDRRIAASLTLMRQLGVEVCV